MGIPVMLMGPSGSGKSSGMRNFSPDEVGIFNVATKALPFRKKLPVVNKATYPIILKGLKKANRKTYIIDDSQYLMAFESFSNASVTGYGKYTTMAVNFYNLIKTVIEDTPDDCIVYFLHHSETDPNTGIMKAKTLGKMLDNQLTIEGLFSIVLVAEVNRDGHWFLTQSDGYNPAKSPMDMFQSERIENDLKMVDDTIREYYELKETKKS